MLAVGRGFAIAADSKRTSRASEREGPAFELTNVTALPAADEPADVDGYPGTPTEGITASDGLPGIRDEHNDGTGWQARVARSPDLGSNGHPQRSEADRDATGRATPPLGEPPGRLSSEPDARARVRGRV